MMASGSQNMTSYKVKTIASQYTANGGQQPPNYFGTNTSGILMMNTTVNGNSQYKDWLIMDAYHGTDVGGGVAIGVNRQSLGAYIMRSAATRTAWAESAELLGTHNAYTYLDSRYVNVSGDTMTGALNLKSDLNLYTGSADSPDIVWWYADKGKEQARIWVGSGGSSVFAPTYRCYNSSGTQLYSGNLVIGDGTGVTNVASFRGKLSTWALVSSSYNTFMPPDGTTNAWYKFGTADGYGILPAVTGGAENGHSYIGTSSWYWKYLYVDRAYTGKITIQQPAAHRDNGIVGTYDYTKAAAIWSMGESYQIKADGSGLGSLYGAAYGYQSQAYIGSKKLAGGHQFIWCENGVPQVALGSSGVWVKKGTGIIWDPYVESTSDASDISQIIQVASGVAGGTELRIQQANDADDVINLMSPAYIYLNSKRAFQINDAWLRINDGGGFSSGIYCGTSTLRTDGTLQVGSAGSNFYANSSGHVYIKSSLSIATDSTSYNLYVNGTSRGNDQLFIYNSNTGRGDAYSGGIQLREFGVQTTSCTLNLYNAPGITFHWGGRWANKLSIYTGGYLYWGSTRLLTTEIGASRYHVGSTSNCTYILVTINPQTSWMLNFTLKVYQGYHATDIQISGYNYGSNHWYQPQAVILGSTTTAAIKVYFGYTANYALYIAIDGGSYSGADVINVVNGYTQISMDDAFTVSKVSSLPGTIQTTVTAYRPWYRDETVSTAASCSGNSATATALTSNAGGGEQPIYFTGGKPAATSYALKATVNAGTATRIAYYSAARAISSGSIVTDGSYLRNIGGYNNASYALSTNSFICNSWVRTKGSTGWYNEDYGGGWYMADNKWNRSYGSKPVLIDIGTNNTYGIGGHRLALGLSGGSHTSILLKGGDVMYGFCVNNDGNWYFGRRTSKSFESTSGDAYLLYGNSTTFYPYIDNSINLGTSSKRWATCYAVNFYGYLNGNISGSSSSCTGNAATATKATNDGDGNKISTTYAKIAAHNNLTAHGNEFTFASSEFSGTIWFNYRTAGGTNGNITQYTFGNGKGGQLASITSGTFNGNCSGSAAKLGTANKGSTNHPIYLSGGTPTECHYPVSGAWYSAVPFIHSDGMMEIGRYIDFHGTSNMTGDHTIRLTCATNTARIDCNGIFAATGWSDLAEYRRTIEREPGRAVIPTDCGIAKRATKRLQPGARIVSDTYGFCLGESDDEQSPIALTGRVLAYPCRPISEYHAGDAVCSGPNGTVDLMTREEIQQYPDCIIGIVNEIPTYPIWNPKHTDDRQKLVFNESVEVRGRIWIDVK